MFMLSIASLIIYFIDSSTYVRLFVCLNSLSLSLSLPFVSVSTARVKKAVTFIFTITLANHEPWTNQLDLEQSPPHSLTHSRWVSWADIGRALSVDMNMVRF